MANYAQGIRAESQGDTESALKFYKLALDKDPTLTDASLKLAKECLRKRNLKKATSYLKKGIRYSPSNSVLYATLGFTYTLTNENVKARQSINQALSLDQTNHYAHALLYELDLQKQGNLKAQKLLEERSSTLNSKSIFWERLGEAYAHILTERNQMSAQTIANESLPFFKKGLSLSPTNFSLLTRVTEIMTQNKNYEEAAQLYQKALTDQTENEKLLSRLALVYLSWDKKTEAIQTMEKILKLNPKRHTLYLALANLHGQLGHQEKSKKYLKKAHKNNFDPLLLADIAIQNQDLPLAEFFLKETLKKPDANESIWIELTLIFLQQNKLKEALKTITTAYEKFPESIKIILTSAEAHRFAKKMNQAHSLLDKAEQLASQKKEDSFMDEVHYQKGVLYEQNKKYEKAEQHLRKAMQLNPQHHHAMNYLSYMWADQGLHLEEAFVMIKKALSFAPKNPAYLDTLGWVYYQQGKYFKALAKIQQAIQQEEDPEIYEHLGDIYDKMKKFKEASKAWKKAYTLDSDRKNLKQKLKLIKTKIQKNNPPN